MRKIIICLTAFLCLAPLTAMAGIDGKWSAEFQPGKKAKASKKATGPATMSLTSSGQQLTGSIGAGKRSLTIQDGKLDGSSFTFVTIGKSKKGESKMLWSGTLEGDTIRGTRSREGGKRGTSFVAKRTQ